MCIRDRDKDNAWYCNKCKDHVQATKKIQIYKTPAILILHLKRFRTNRINSIGSYFYTAGSSKVSTFIDFPIEGLDLARYVLQKSEQPVVYDLFAVSNHYGGLGGGHYTAAAKHFRDGVWYDFNDASVSKAGKDDVVSEAAYVLFYRRRDASASTPGRKQTSLLDLHQSSLNNHVLGILFFMHV
eukprot:TRINITY_DN6677_c0_g1_i3.p2 TRINITY_DN6677_c0_g1~~TRINITY_DN6677_c0_g1_i3.p2  ORF type:complete len:184 (+),score=34.77 TRINITY_DN6677_c0_g1_i3:67-618(+)